VPINGEQLQLVTDDGALRIAILLHDGSNVAGKHVLFGNSLGYDDSGVLANHD
jgi:hypothetical protein